ncbi:murein biosynthesis integral membrane protein MurJ [Kitasatospora sp. NPDC057904]|uniref:murein biosynthesis integral membrane protein MurJ n=1 Tax=unclassified Kitasatospora TaxID=2633591 RepID=UPI0036DBC43F
MTIPSTCEPTGPYDIPTATPSGGLPSAPVPPSISIPAPGVTPATGPTVNEASATARAGRTSSGSLIMALGSLTSRALGFVRAAVIAAALGTAAVGDGYAVATMLPNTIFIMLIGGVLNSVFVPELVRAAQQHDDHGAAYTNRLLTACGTALLVITALAFTCAPTIVDAYTGYGPHDTAQRELTLALARYCLPAILFHGLFGLLGQVLNSRDRFGAMMWAPVLNNAVVIAVFALYLVLYDYAGSAEDVSGGGAALLGLGSAFGVLVQALALLPSLRASGFRYRPRFDWRGADLAGPLRAAGWALLLVVVTQLSFLAITNLATGALSKAHGDGLTAGLGYSAYNNAYLLFNVPQGIVSVSLVTAILPGMSRSATAGRFTEVGRELARTLRTTAGIIVPATLGLLALAGPITDLAYGHGGVSTADTEVIAQTLAAFALGLPAFCAQYTLARGFYAMGDARTPFWLTAVTAGSNVLLSAVAFLVLPSRWIIVGMAVAHTLAVLIGAALTSRALDRRLRREAEALRTSPPPAGTQYTPARSGLDDGGIVRLHLTLVIAGAPGALAGYCLAGWSDDLLDGGAIAAMTSLGFGSAAVLASVLVLARPLGADSVVAPLARRLRIPYPAPARRGRHRR